MDSDPQMSKAVDHLCPVGSCIELKVGAQVTERVPTDLHCACVKETSFVMIEAWYIP